MTVSDSTLLLDYLPIQHCRRLLSKAGPASYHRNPERAAIVYRSSPLKPFSVSKPLDSFALWRNFSPISNDGLDAPSAAWESIKLIVVWNFHDLVRLPVRVLTVVLA